MTAAHHPLAGMRLAVEGRRAVHGAACLIARVPDGTPGTVLPRERVVWLHFLVVSLTTCVIQYLSFAWAEQYVSSSVAL